MNQYQYYGGSNERKRNQHLTYSPPSKRRYQKIKELCTLRHLGCSISFSLLHSDHSQPSVSKVTGFWFIFREGKYLLISSRQIPGTTQPPSQQSVRILLPGDEQHAQSWPTNLRWCWNLEYTVLHQMPATFPNVFQTWQPLQNLRSNGENLRHARFQASAMK